MSSYFKSVPFLLQYVINPLDSIYISIAIIKTLIQASLLYLLSVYITGVTAVFNRKFLIAAILITPFFQTFGFDQHINIVDPSITYAFFYGLSLAWLMLFFLPIFLHYFHDRPLPSSRLAGWLMVPLAWAASFNGALNPALMILGCFAVAMVYAFGRLSRNNGERAFSKTSPMITYGLVSGFVCAFWSFYVSRFELQNNQQASPTLAERYDQLPLGLEDYFFISTPLPLILLIAAILNLILINALRLGPTRRINRLSLGFLLLAVVYILLLPMGGFRQYRPVIIRWDTMLPVLLGMLIIYGMTTLRLLLGLKRKQALVYAIVPLGLMINFTVVDESGQGYNHGERRALHEIAIAPGRIIHINGHGANIMAWEKIKDYRKSETNAQLLYLWHVFPEVKYYYQD
jgi:hypothetical protein